MSLHDSYKTAEAVAEGFRSFSNLLPEHDTEITSLVVDLFSISLFLKGLEGMARNRAYRYRLSAIHPDLELVRASLNYTLEDVLDFFDDLESRRGDPSEAYKQLWVEICAHFMEESQESLSTRLAKYKSFLRDLSEIMKGEATDTRLMASLRSNLKGLLVHQDSRLAPRLGSMSLRSPVNARRPRGRRSYERARPSHSSPQSPTSTSSATFSDIPPSVPSAPDSPTTSTTATSQSMDSTPVSDHWARRVFLDEHPMTPIPYVGESSKCLGEVKGNVKGWLHDEGFEELFQLAFSGDSDLRVCFYLREDDHRVRIVCKSRRTSRSSDYSCLPLNLLEIVRIGSCLQICRRRRGGSELVLWANLKFSTIEQMVIFFCTFLALRSQDSGRPVERIRDYELDDEEEHFGGQIVDDDFLHALRVYRDNVSGAVRLQASVHKGEMKRMPVWTAFITEHIGSRGWIRRVDTKTILLRDLRRVIFTFPSYNPPRTPKGEHILKFTNKSDAQGFMDTIAELAHL
ncbi:Maltose acetyltransferase family protein [Aspergillus niger]|uniref:Maltose acetyltransferase family protein n=1 Tax=Aspergillus niger TaxID=5061 RepID=A0A505IBH5_ASPNG|nr:Maltose acetyltransferase family protein [Aspergillus niger]